MFATALKAAGLSIGVLMVLNAAGVQTAEVLTFLGVLSLTIGFALRDTLSTIISSFLVLVDRPFTIDDLVEVDGQYGRVEKITLCSTRIVTADSHMLAVTKLNDYNAWASNYKPGLITSVSMFRNDLNCANWFLRHSLLPM